MKNNGSILMTKIILTSYQTKQPSGYRPSLAESGQGIVLEQVETVIGHPRCIACCFLLDRKPVSCPRRLLRILEAFSWFKSRASHREDPEITQVVARG